MKKLFVVLVVLFGLIAFVSCDIPEEKIKDQYGEYQQNNRGDFDSGKDEEPDRD